jgi:RNA recognition motif-containing protein
MTTRLFIGGLSWGTTDESLAAAFAVHGTVVDARVIYDRETGRSRGFGFVTFADPEEAALAVRAMNGADLDGRAIRVDPAEERPNPRRRTRDEDGLSASRS